MKNNLPVMDMTDNPTGCCPRFDPGPWKGAEIHFGDLQFLSAQTRSFLYVPLDMDKVMSRTQAAIDKAGATPKDRYLMLSQDLGPWKARHYFLVEKAVSGYNMQTLPGTWRTEVYEGSFSQMGQWYKDFATKLQAKGQEPTDTLAFYTTCPKCAKAYGKNYVVLLGRVKD